MVEIVNKNSRIPKYLQIEGWIEEMIAKGRFQIGDKLPSETKLAELSGVNRNTIRQAIAALANRGILATRNGVGTFINSGLPQKARYSLDRISSFADDIREAGYRPRTKLISRRVVQAAKEISDKLMLGSSSRVIEIVRLRLGDRIPLIVEKSHLPYNEFRTVLDRDLTGSLYQLLVEEFGAQLDRSVQSFRAALLEGQEAALLDVPPGSPGVFLESIIYDAKGVALELLQSHYRGDKYVFQVHTGNYQVSLEPQNNLMDKEANTNVGKGCTRKAARSQLGR
jgi:GntR family transcriptional regulator